MALLVPNHHVVVPDTKDRAIFTTSMGSTDEDIFYVELFGDSIMCGKDPDLPTPRCGVCSNADPITGRVPQPPGKLINFFLPQYKIMVTTRSSGNSTSGQLLHGTDGVNGPWPDGIEANIVIINHGLNDAKNGIPVEEYKQNLISLREGLRPDQVMIWQTPTINYYWDTTPYAEAMREVAFAYDDIVADTHKIKPNWLGEVPDGIHPRQLGYVELVDLCLSHRINFAILRLLGTEPDQSHKFYRKDYQQKFVLEEEDEVLLDFKPTAHRWTEVYFRDNISYRVVSRGLRDKYGILDPGIYDARSGQKLYSPERSYNLIKIKRDTGLIVKKESFDVASDPDEAIRLANTLNATSNQYIIILMSHDDPRDNRLQPELVEAIYRCGASEKIFANPLFKFRSSYILVGIPGCGEGNGIETYNGCEDATDENTILRPNKGLGGRKRKPRPLYYSLPTAPADGIHRKWSPLLNEFSIWDDDISANVVYSEQHLLSQILGVPAGARGPALGEGTLKNVVPTNYKIYKKQGIYYYTVPDGVTEIEVLISGAGGSGADGSEDPVSVSAATGGYAGEFKRSNVSVIPGETLTIEVGEGGQPILYGLKTAGDPGGESSVKQVNGNVLISANGGLGGNLTGAVFPVDDYPDSMQDDFDEYWNNIEAYPPGSTILWGNGTLEKTSDVAAIYTSPTQKKINIYKDLELNNVALADPDIRLYFQQTYAFFPKQVTSAGSNNQGLIDFGLGGYGGNFTFEQTGGDGLNGAGGSAVEEVKSALVGHWTVDSGLTAVTENVAQFPVVEENILYRSMPNNSKPSMMLGIQGLSWIEYPSTSALSLAQERFQNYTIEAWIYPTGPSGDEYWGGMIVSKENEYRISLSMQRKISVSIDWGEGPDVNLPGGGWYETPVEIPYDQPSHIALVVDKDTFQIYVNSTLEHTQPSLDRVKLPSMNSIYIGNDSSGNAQFKGYIADVRIWDVARTGSEIGNNINQITTGISDFKGSASGRGGDGMVIIGTPDNPIPSFYQAADLYFSAGIIPLLKNLQPNNGSPPTEDVLLIGEEVTQDDLLQFGITKSIDEIGVVLPGDIVDWVCSFTADHHVRIGYWIWDVNIGPTVDLTHTLFFGTYSASGRQTDVVRGEFAVPDNFSTRSILVIGVGDGDWKSGMHNVTFSMTSYVRNISWTGRYYEWDAFFPKPDYYIFQISADNSANLQIGFLPSSIGSDSPPPVVYEHVIATQGSRQLRYGTVQETPHYINSCGWYRIRMYAENFNDFIDPPEYYPTTGAVGVWSWLLNNYGVEVGDRIWEVKILTPDTYTFAFSVDNYGWIGIQPYGAADDDFDIVIDLVGSPSRWFTNEHTAQRNLTPGLYVVKIVARNTGGPGAVAATIKDSTGKLVWNTRDSVRDPANNRGVAAKVLDNGGLNKIAVLDLSLQNSYVKSIEATVTPYSLVSSSKGFLSEPPGQVIVGVFGIESNNANVPDQLVGNWYVDTVISRVVESVDQNLVTEVGIIYQNIPDTGDLSMIFGKSGISYLSYPSSAKLQLTRYQLQTYMIEASIYPGVTYSSVLYLDFEDAASYIELKDKSPEDQPIQWFGGSAEVTTLGFDLFQGAPFIQTSVEVSVGNYLSVAPGINIPDPSFYDPTVAVFGYPVGTSENTITRHITSNYLIDLSAAKSLLFKVNAATSSTWGDPPDGNGEALYLEYSTDQSTWTNIKTINPSDVSGGQWFQFEVLIPAGAKVPGGVYMRYRQNKASVVDIPRDLWAMTPVMIKSDSPSVYPEITTATSKHGGASIYFNGSNYMDVEGRADFVFNNDFTIEGWVYIDSVPAGGYQTIFELNDYRNGILFRHGDGTGLNNHFYVNGVNLGDSRQYFTTGIWHHFAITRESGIVRLFADGILRISGFVNGTVNTGGGRLRVGKSLHISDQWSPPMYIDEFRIINGRSLYNSNFTPPEQALGSFVVIAGYPSDEYGMIVNKDSEYELALKSNGKLAVALDWGVGADVNLPGGGWYETDAVIPLNQVSDIKLLVEATTFYIYVNGDLKHTQTNLDRSSQPSNNPVYIGNRAGGTTQFKGFISGVKITKASGPADERFIRTANKVDLSDAISLTYSVNKGTSGNWGQVPENDEEIQLEYSLNGITWTKIDSTSPSSVSSNTWTEKMVVATDQIKVSSGVYLRYKQKVNPTVALPKDTWAMTNIVKTAVVNELWHTRHARNLKEIEEYGTYGLCDPFNSYSEIEFDVSSSGVPFAVDVHPPRYEAMDTSGNLVSFSGNVFYDIVANIPPVNGTRLLNPQYPTYKTGGIPHETFHIMQYHDNEKYRLSNQRLWIRNNDVEIDDYDRFEGRQPVEYPDFIKDEIPPPVVVQPTYPLAKFEDGYVEYSSGGRTSEIISVQDTSPPDISSGAMSFSDGVLYRGTGSSTEVVGRIDTIKNGLDGSSLRIDFGYEFANGGLDGPLEGGPTIYTLNGWTIYNEQVRLDGLSEIEGWPTPIDNNDPIGRDGGTSPDTDISTVTSWVGSVTLSNVTPSSSGGDYLELTTGNFESESYGVIHGPYMVSETSVELAANDTVSFEWQAQGGDDDYDVFGYLLNIETGDTIELLNDSGRTTTWTTVTQAVPAAGRYKFVFISGSFDYSGGRALGAKLQIDSIDVNGSPPIFTPGQLQSITNQISYVDTSPPPLPPPVIIDDKIAVFGYNSSSALCFMEFDGIDDYADIVVSGLGNVVTVEMWCKIGENYAGRMFFGWRTYDVWCSGGTLGFNTGNGDVYGISEERVASLECVGNWKQYVFVMHTDVSYTNNMIFVNGIEQSLSQQIGSENPAARNFGDSIVRLSGWTINNDYRMPMKCSYFRIYNRELTADEILQNFVAARRKHGI